MAPFKQLKSVGAGLWHVVRSNLDTQLQVKYADKMIWLYYMVDNCFTYILKDNQTNGKTSFENYQAKNMFKSYRFWGKI